MTAAKPTTDARPREAVPVGTAEDLPALVAKLGNDLLRLVDGKLGLLKLDLEEQVRGYAHELLIGATAAIGVAGGVILSAAGLAFAVAYMLPTGLDPLLARALAFAAVGGSAALAGWVFLRRIGKRFGAPDQKSAPRIAPTRTTNER